LFIFQTIIHVASAAFILLFTIFESWGEYVQGRRIWREESAEKIAPSSYFLDTAVVIATSIYGFHIGDWLYVFSGVVSGAVLLYIVAGVWKYSPHLNWLQYVGAVVSITFLCAMVTLLILGVGWWVELLMGGSMLLNILTEGQKCYFLGRGEGTGDFVPKTTVIWFLSNLAFMGYGYVIDDWVFFQFCFGYVLVQAFTIFVYWIKWSEVEVSVDGQIGLRAFVAHVRTKE